MNNHNCRMNLIDLIIAFNMSFNLRENLIISWL
jgi:hypothetical protein